MNCGGASPEIRALGKLAGFPSAQLYLMTNALPWSSIGIRAPGAPRGARSIGIYESQVASGQLRVLLVWTLLIMPNVHLDGSGATEGRRRRRHSSLEDDNHCPELFKAALLSTVPPATTTAGCLSRLSLSALQGLRSMHAFHRPKS